MLTKALNIFCFSFLQNFIENYRSTYLQKPSSAIKQSCLSNGPSARSVDLQNISVEWREQEYNSKLSELKYIPWKLRDFSAAVKKVPLSCFSLYFILRNIAVYIYWIPEDTDWCAFFRRNCSHFNHGLLLRCLHRCVSSCDLDRVKSS